MREEILFFDTLREGLWISVLISLPILTVALVGGVLVGLFQALTSIQEMTLTFVPKLAAIGATFWLAMEFMSAAFLDLWRDNLIPLIASGAA